MIFQLLELLWKLAGTHGVEIFDLIQGIVAAVETHEAGWVEYVPDDTAKPAIKIVHVAP